MGQIAGLATSYDRIVELFQDCTPDLLGPIFMDISLRRLRADDISQVIDIEREAFSPLWTSTPFKRDLRNRRACYLVACTGAGKEEPEPEEGSPTAEAIQPWRRLARGLRRLVGGGDQRTNGDSLIAGYVSVWYQQEEAHITEIAVREKFRGRGIGELLLIGSLRAAIEYGSRAMTLEARVSNFIAQRLYEKYLFKSVGTRRAYYADNREDAVIMTVECIDSEDYLDRFEELQDAYRSRWGEICIDL